MSFSAKLYDVPASLLAEPKRTILPLETGGSGQHYVVVHSLSSEGMLVEAHHGISVGSIILFEIAGLGRHMAKAVWNDGSFYDCTFVTPLDTEVVRRKLTDAKVVWGNFGSWRPRRPAPVGRGAPAPIALLPTSPRMRGGRPECSPMPLAMPWGEPLDDEEHWRGGGRLALIFGGAVAGWGIFYALLHHLLG